jgi:site-specific DNA recombinase
MKEMDDLVIERAAILARVSTDEQVKGTSLTTQIEDCRAKARDLGYVVDDQDLYVEDGVSGSLRLEERPTLQRMFKLIEGGCYAAVISYSPDRLSRAMVEYMLFERDVRNHGCQIIHVTESYDDSLEGRFQMRVMAAVAELERGFITRRTIRGREKVLSTGGFGGGRVPFGYRWSKEDGWSIDEQAAQIVRNVFRWYLRDGYTLKQIARKLNELGEPAPQGGAWWKGPTINVLIRQSAYVGVKYGLRGRDNTSFDSIAALQAHAANQEWVNVPNFPPIFVREDGTPDVELWDKAQQRRKANRLGGTGHRTLNWSLQARVRCAACGSILRCHRYRGGKRVYWCVTGRDPVRVVQQKRCTTKVSADDLEGAVSSSLSLALADPDAIRLAADNYLSRLDSKIFGLERKVRPLEEEIKGLKAKIRRANDLYTDGKMDNGEHKQVYAPLREKVQILETNSAEGGVAIRQLDGLRQSKASIRLAMRNGSLVAANSLLRGLKLLELRTEDERQRYVSENGRRGGVAGINELRYKAEHSDLNFTQLVNMLSLNVTVHSDRVVVDGLIPMDIAMADVVNEFPKLEQKGFSKTSSSGRACPSRSSWRLGFGGGL